MSRSLAQVVFDSLSELDSDSRAEMLEDIVLVGGSAHLDGLGDRLEEDLKVLPLNLLNYPAPHFHYCRPGAITVSPFFFFLWYPHALPDFVPGIQRVSQLLFSYPLPEVNLVL